MVLLLLMTTETCLRVSPIAAVLLQAISFYPTQCAPARQGFLCNKTSTRIPVTQKSPASLVSQETQDLYPTRYHSSSRHCRALSGYSPDFTYLPDLYPLPDNGGMPSASTLTFVIWGSRSEVSSSKSLVCLAASGSSLNPASSSTTPRHSI